MFHNEIKMKKSAVLTSFLSLFLSCPALAFAQQVTIKMDAPSNLRVTNFGVLMSGAIGLILVVAALFCFFFLIWGGISWITSGGDKSGVEAAQKRIQAALIGLFVVFAAWALMTIVGGFFGFDISSLKFPVGYQTPTPTKP
jgi:hypothetical protein